MQVISGAKEGPSGRRRRSAARNHAGRAHSRLATRRADSLLRSGWRRCTSRRRAPALSMRAGFDIEPCLLSKISAESPSDAITHTRLTAHLILATCARIQAASASQSPSSSVSRLRPDHHPIVPGVRSISCHRVGQDYVGCIGDWRMRACHRAPPEYYQKSLSARGTSAANTDVTDSDSETASGESSSGLCDTSRVTAISPPS